MLRGPMSRNAKVLSDSKIFIDGISPVAKLAQYESSKEHYVPLMILQKIQAAVDIVVLKVSMS